MSVKTIERQIRESICSAGSNVYEQLTVVLTRQGWDKGWRYKGQAILLNGRSHSELGITLDKMLEEGDIRLETRQHINTKGIKPFNKGE